MAPSSTDIELIWQDRPKRNRLFDSFRGALKTWSNNGVLLEITQWVQAAPTDHWLFPTGQASQ